MAMTCWCGDNHQPECPRCDKCGAPVETGAMALFCPKGRDCEFWVPEVETINGMFGRATDPTPAAQSEGGK